MYILHTLKINLDSLLIKKPINYIKNEYFDSRFVNLSS